jgi:hypothetical protein
VTSELVSSPPVTMQEIAAATIGVLLRTGWNPDGALDTETGRICLAVAASRVVTENSDAFRQFCEAVRLQIKASFPGRGPEIPEFNDHPDTTFEDVMLVLKKVAGEGS